MTPDYTIKILDGRIFEDFKEFYWALKLTIFSRIFERIFLIMSDFLRLSAPGFMFRSNFVMMNWIAYAIKVFCPPPIIFKKWWLYDAEEWWKFFHFYSQYSTSNFLNNLFHIRKQTRQCHITQWNKSWFTYL